MFERRQFRSLVRRTLQAESLWSKSAENLVLGTIAQESKFGTYLRQLGNGPARGIAQCEKVTFEDLKERYGSKFSWLAGREFEELEWDLRLAILVCRLKYLSIPRPLPPFDNLTWLANYWKKWYNTYLGAGKVKEFVESYQSYVREFE